MFLIKKISDLKHVPFSYKLRLLSFQLKKTLRLPYEKKDYELNTFLTTHLLRFNGSLVDENEESYTTDFYFENDKPSRLTIRKPPSSDFAVFDQVFVFKEYQAFVELVKKNRDYKQPLNILDAGGNVGFTSIFFNNVFPGSNFGIVEPDTQNYFMLEKNIQQNNFNACSLINGGVWNSDTSLTINRGFRDGNDWSVNVTESAVPSTLKGFSIPSLMKQLNFDLIDLLKIDIEGSEKQLFDDPYSAGEFLSRTKFIAIEIHDEFECRDQINDCLLKNNFDFFLADGLTMGYNRNLVM